MLLKYERELLKTQQHIINLNYVLVAIVRFDIILLEFVVDSKRKFLILN
jgi:hypothetical protein